MKNLIFILFTFYGLMGLSQNLVHTKGVKGIGSAYHYTEKGFAVSLEYQSFERQKMYYSLGLNYENGAVGFTDFDVYLFNPAIGYSPLNINQKIYFNFEAGGFVGWENRLAKFDFPQQTNFIYGFNAKAEIESFLTSQIAFIVNYSQMATLNSEFGLFRYQIGAGLNIYF